MSPLVTLLLGIVLIFALIVGNAFFVAQEFAYMSVDRSRLRALAADGDEAAGRALAVTRRTSFMLSGAQLGITVTGLLIGELAEPMIGGSLAEMIGAAGATAAIAAGILLVATVIQMIFAELYPKNLAIAAPEPLARALARSTQVYLFLFGWLIAFFDWSSNALLRLVGVTPVEDVDSTADSKDLGRIVADSRASGDLPPDLSMLIDRILDFPEHTVEHAMVPRAKLGEMDPTTTVAEARERMAGGHTRYPVMGHVEDETTHEEEERLYGVLHLDDILDPDLPPETPVGQLVREPVVLPEVMPLPDAVVELSESDNRLACVVDEYGGVSGVVTVEDLAEELVGELTDEHDAEEHHISHEAGVGPDNDQWRIAGDEHLDEVARVLDVRLPVGEYETLAGLLIEELGALPDVGQIVRVELPDDPREVVEHRHRRRVLVAEVVELGNHVPTELLVRLEVTDDE
ncbi:MAG TPA: hemolysin family protein [Candidatus Corynebacterium faecigallinarum]|uniref:Hemolysin family protein n=1 Tax=Candidatus Corynebacterium faecigallinarum TaxID=2838528 RepID=A0A9D2TPQ3_9CORY|nr:hemolysin family protein [Candidatus Corynebacterium faecigallinarum]